MATIVTKYSIGDEVWFATMDSVRKQRPCPDCLGAKKWSVTSPGGVTYSFACPRCTAIYRSDRDASLEYSEYTGAAKQLTIGSVQHNSHGGSFDSGNRYMCHETGVGSGSVYNEDDLFVTQEEALTVANLRASAQNAETPWIIETMKKSLELSDYQLSDARERIWESRAQSAESGLRYLIEDIEACDSIEEVRSQIEDFCERRAAA